MTPRPFLHWLLLIALVATWGTSFLMTKLALTGFTPTGIVVLRLVVAAVVLSAAVVASRRKFAGNARLWWFFLAGAVFGNCLPFWLISWGQQGIDSGLAGILMAVMPLATLVLAHFLVAGERMNPAKAAGFGLGFAGIVVLIGPEALSQIETGGSRLISQLAVLGGAVCYAIATIIARHRPPSDALVAATGVGFVAAVIMLPMLSLEAPLRPAPPSLAATAAITFLGVLSTGLASIVYYRLITLAGPTFLSLINYLIPLWALAVGMAILGEQPGWRVLAALALILGGIALSETRGRRALASPIKPARR